MIQIEELESYNNNEEAEKLIDSETVRAKFRLLGPLSKGHNIVAYIRGSSRRIRVFKEYTGRIILIDNYTRWNS